MNVKMEHGNLFEQHIVYGIRVTVTAENLGSCDSIFSIDVLNKNMSENLLCFLLENIEYSINQCILGLLGKIPTIDYPKIDKGELK